MSKAEVVMDEDSVQIIGVGSYQFEPRRIRVKKKIQFGFGMPQVQPTKAVVKKPVNKKK